MYNELIAKSGLSKDQADVYSTLLEGGHMTARKLSLKTGLKRGLAYKVLDQLIEMELVEKNEKIGKIALFFPAHPSKIKEVLKKRQEEIASAENALGGVMNQMVSSYNLISGKPNVQFFEGIEGMMHAGSDSLESQTEIYEYIDNETVAKDIPEFNEEYAKKRKQFQIKKKLLCIDSPFNRERTKKLDPNITEVRFIKSSPFSTVMQIYDNKVSYITLNRNKMMGIIIESPEIFEMHKTLFENMWTMAETRDNPSITKIA